MARRSRGRMLETKWIPDLSPELPVAAAARHVLGLRLRVVGHYLPLAIHQAKRDREYVHQLRVGTRRAVAALNLFQACLPSQTFSTARKRLRQIRNFAGAARDWDVFSERILEGTDTTTGAHLLRGYILAQRAAAQRLLNREGQFAIDQFLVFVAQVVSDLSDPAEPRAQTSLISLARPILAQLITDLESAISADLKDEEQLHRVRITGKKLRYAMEIFGDCFTSEFRTDLYPMIEEMQEILGRFNDCRVAIGFLDELRAYAGEFLPVAERIYRPLLVSRLRQQRRLMQKERKSFSRWLETWRTVNAVAKLHRVICLSLRNNGEAIASQRLEL